MKRALLFLLLVAHPMNAAEPTLVERLLTAVPKAQPGEFKTPESVIRTFYEGSITGDLNRTAKCFPVHEEFAASNFVADVTYLGVYKPRSTPFAGDHYSRFARALAYHSASLANVHVSFLLTRDPDIEDLFEVLPDLRDGEGTLSEEKIKALEARLNVASFKGITVKSIESDVEPDPRPVGKSRATHLQVFVVVLAFGEQTVKHDVFVAKYGSNYLIKSIDVRFEQ